MIDKEQRTQSFCLKTVVQWQMTNEMFTENTSLQHHKKIANHSDFKKEIYSLCFMHLALTFLPNHALEHQLRFQLFYSQFFKRFL